MSTLRVPDVVPPPAQDCEKLHKAFEGWGTDEKAIIWILGHRNARQRRIIRETYQQLYNKSLIDHLHSELSGDFRKAVILWTYDPPERDARLAKDALKTRKNDINHLQVIVEIACASSPHHLMSVRQAYCSLFESSLEEDITASVSPPFKKLLVGLVRSYRYDKKMVDLEIAKMEAAKLHEAINKKQLDHDDVVWIISTRNVFQLKVTFEIYKQYHGNSIDEDIKGCSNDELASLLRLIIRCIVSPEKHFAEVIRASIIGLGTDEDSLTRAIVMRAEIDMMKIKGEYLDTHKASLDDAVVDDTSGDYKDFLMTLLGSRI